MKTSSGDTAEWSADERLVFMELWSQREVPFWRVFCEVSYGGTPAYRIFAAGETGEKLLRLVAECIWRAEQGLTQGKLLLPDMGDYQIEYVF
jgi:hypothetical protein